MNPITLNGAAQDVPTALGALETAINEIADDGAFKNVGNLFTAAQSVEVKTLSEAPTITLDALIGNRFALALTGNVTLANPTNLVTGSWFEIHITDTTGGHSLALDSAWKLAAGETGNINDAVGGVSILWGICYVAGRIECGVKKCGV